MLNTVLNFISTTLDEYIKYRENTLNDAPKTDFPTANSDRIILSNGRVSILLVNIEEEKKLRPANPYVQRSEEGLINSVSRPIRLELSLLFVSKFDEYVTSLKYLSHVIQFFQTNTVFHRELFPALPDVVERLQVELYSMNNTQKNELWSSLKLAYLPSIGYKVKMLAFQQQIPNANDTITEPQLNLNHK